jgi:hypothetical protein
MSIEANLGSIRTRIRGVLQPIADSQSAKLNAQRTAEAQARAIRQAQIAEATRQKEAYTSIISQIEGLEREAERMPYFGAFFKRRAVFRDLAKQRKLAQQQYPQGYKAYRAERFAWQQEIARHCAQASREREAAEKAAKAQEEREAAEAQAEHDYQFSKAREHSESLG